MSLELRHYRLFVTVAELRSFSAAGRALGLAQPSVSRSVATLERRLGVQLVVRSTRHFALTAAGDTLYAEARLVLDAATAAEARTRAAADDARVVVAAKVDSASDLLERVIDAGGRDAVPVRVDPLFREPHELDAAVVRGEADVCLTQWRVAAAGLTAAVLWTEPRVAVLAADHPLGDRPDVTLHDFATEPVARWPGVPGELDRYYQGLDGAAAHVTRTGPAVRGLSEALRLVELGRATTFLPRSIAHRVARPALKAVAVHGLSPSSMQIAWRAGALRPPAERVVELCRRAATG